MKYIILATIIAAVALVEPSRAQISGKPSNGSQERESGRLGVGRSIEIDGLLVKLVSIDVLNTVGSESAEYQFVAPNDLALIAAVWEYQLASDQLYNPSQGQTRFSLGYEGSEGGFPSFENSPSHDILSGMFSAQIDADEVEFADLTSGVSATRVDVWDVHIDYLENNGLYLEIGSADYGSNFRFPVFEQISAYNTRVEADPLSGSATFGGEWQLYTENDTFTDERQLTLTVESDTFANRSIDLNLHCSNSNPLMFVYVEFFVLTGATYLVEGQTYFISARTRIDDRPMQYWELEVFYGDANDTYLKIDPISLNSILLQMYDGTELLIEVETIDGPVVIAFPISGLRDAVEPIKAECGI